VARRKLKVEDLPTHLQGEARRQLAGGGVDAASLALAELDRDLKPANVLVADRDLKPDNVLDRDVKPQKTPRPPRGMSKTERSYQDRLEVLRAAGEVLAFTYEPLRLVLAPKLTWCPDFAVLRAPQHELDPQRPGFYACPRVRLVEVKPRRSDGRAYWTEDSRVKVKTAAQVHGVLFEIVAVWPNGRGGWELEEFPRRPHA
jgi:hypothetical protein